jgi:hypothetical protein
VAASQAKKGGALTPTQYGGPHPLAGEPRRGRARDLPVRRLRLAACGFDAASRFRAKLPCPRRAAGGKGIITIASARLALALAAGVALLPFGARARIAASANDSKAYLDTRAAIKKPRNPSPNHIR